MAAEPRNAIVTGAASGLGRALAVRLARDRWRLALVDLDESGLQETLAMVEAAGGAGECTALDVGDPAAWQRLRDSLGARWPRLDLLVNNAGVCGAGAIGRFPLDDWSWLLQANLFGPIYGCHTMVAWLKENPQRGHVINVASAAGLLAPPSMGAYNVAKAGVIALSETLYGELRPYGIGVTVVCPGFFGSNLVEQGRFCTAGDRRAADALSQQARLTADKVAERTVRAMHRRRLYVIEPFRARWLWRFKRSSPAVFHRAVAYAIARWNRKSASKAAVQSTERQLKRNT